MYYTRLIEIRNGGVDSLEVEDAFYGISLGSGSLWSLDPDRRTGTPGGDVWCGSGMVRGVWGCVVVCGTCKKGHCIVQPTGHGVLSTCLW